MSNIVRFLDNLVSKSLNELQEKEKEKENNIK